MDIHITSRLTTSSNIQITCKHLLGRIATTAPALGNQLFRICTAAGKEGRRLSSSLKLLNYQTIRIFRKATKRSQEIYYHYKSYFFYRVLSIYRFEIIYRY